MKLENVSPAQRRNSSHYSLSQCSPIAIQWPLRVSYKTINLAKHTPYIIPYKSLRKEGSISNQSVKKRKLDNKEQGIRHKDGVHDIDIVGQIWLGFPIHEVVALENKNMSLKEKCTNYKFECIGTPLNEVEEFCTFWHNFPIASQKCYPNKRLDAISGQYLYFIISLTKKRLAMRWDFLKV